MDDLARAAPLLLLLALLLLGRAGPVVACLAGLAAAVPAVAVSLPPGSNLLSFLPREALRALFLGLQPVAVLAGGLLFAAAAAPRAAEGAPATPRRVYVMTLLAGVFVETVTGFGVGAVFALSALRGMGLGGAPAGALALLALTLVPWGGLGPGTALGAALAGRPVAELSLTTALPHAGWLLLLPPVLWSVLHRIGMAVPARERAAQMAMQAAVAVLLLIAAWFLPFEIVGIVAVGPLLLLALWRLEPPRDGAGWRRAGRLLAPWVLLTACLLIARLWHGAPAWRPFDDLPALGLTHVAVVLWGVSLLLLALRADRTERLRASLRRLPRPAATMLLYVLLGRWMAGSGAAAALAAGLASVLGALAPFAIPPLGLLSGMVTGSNVASVSALMAVQAGLGAAAGLPPALAPALHNFAGAAGAGVALSNTVIVGGLLGDGTRPGALWRQLWPMILAVPVVGWIALAVLR
ncbi:L-lactate permease [Muricoccus radiodurans]|uniref:L-lactate permease n=1 Tax=Muricoccus radiodurans TaxID=2231721 RepID=UPI003CF9604F